MKNYDIENQTTWKLLQLQFYYVIVFEYIWKVFQYFGICVAFTKILDPAAALYYDQKLKLIYNFRTILQKHLCTKVFHKKFSYWRTYSGSIFFF